MTLELVGLKMSLTEPMIPEQEILQLKVRNFQKSLRASKEFDNFILSTGDIFSPGEIQEMLELEREHREWLRAEIEEGRQRLLNKKDKFRELKEKGLEK